MSQLLLNIDKMITAKCLGIYIITYNRSDKLRQTLTYLVNSIVKDFSITVLDNCSTDNSVEVAKEFISKFPNFIVSSNKFNIGLGANFLKTFDLSEFKYTWVLCDDDKIDIQYFEDVLQVIQQEEVDVIHVGAHFQKNWSFGGRFSTPKEFLAEGYPYFKFSSFIPCNIFRTSSFTQSIIAAYNNVVNVYPHMPFIFDLYRNNKSIYVSKNQLVIAQPSDSGYSFKKWFIWWMQTCELLVDESDVKKAFLDQWKDIGISDEKFGLQSFGHAKSFFDNKELILRFEKKYMNPDDISIIRKYEKQLKGKFKFKVFLYENLVKAKIITPKNLM